MASISPTRRAHTLQINAMGAIQAALHQTFFIRIGGDSWWGWSCPWRRTSSSLDTKGILDWPSLGNSRKLKEQKRKMHVFWPLLLKLRAVSYRKNKERKEQISIFGRVWFRTPKCLWKKLAMNQPSEGTHLTSSYQQTAQWVPSLEDDQEQGLVYH